MLAALVVLIMIVVSNFGALFACCYTTYRYGLWLQTYHSKDLACLRILVLVSSLPLLAGCLLLCWWCHMLTHSGPEWFGRVHHVDLHCLPDQLLIGSPPVGCGSQHSSHGISLHPVWRGDWMVRVEWSRRNIWLWRINIEFRGKSQKSTNMLWTVVRWPLTNLKMTFLAANLRELGSLLNDISVVDSGTSVVRTLFVGERGWQRLVLCAGSSWRTGF